MNDIFDIFNGKQFLVTGGAGAIGSNLVNFLSNYDCRIFILDDLSSGFKENIPAKDNVIFQQGSILDDKILNKIFKNKIDFLFHLAAHFANQNSIEHPLEDLLVNAYGTLKLLKYSQAKGIKKFIYASSSCVYGNVDMELSENLVTKLETPYAISKLSGEEYVHFFNRFHGLNTTVVRYFNAYGPGDIPGRYRNVIPNFFLKALRREPLFITGTGQEIRDFTFMDDIVRGTALTLTTDLSRGQIYNIGTGKPTKILALAEMINSISGNTAGVKFNESRKWDGIKMRLANIDKSRRQLSYSSIISLEEGLVKTWEWFKGKYKT